MKNFRSYSSRETKAFGTDLAKKIRASRHASQRAFVIALQGELGAGKTTFTQGFARGLGIKRRMASPTFIIMRRFALSRAAAPFKNIYHIDAYRLKKFDSFEVLGFKEIFDDPKNIILIEWPEKIKKILPKGTTWVKFQHGKKENERTIKIF